MAGRVIRSFCAIIVVHMPANTNVSLARKVINRANVFQSWQNQTAGQTQPQNTPQLDSSNSAKLDTFDSVLDQVESSSSDYTTLAALASEANAPTSAAPGGAARKEKLEGTAVPSVESGGITYVEQEPQPEIPVEVESFLKRVDNSADKIRQEIVLADAQLATQNQKHPAKPVIVLPITPAIEKSAQGKSTKFSVVWLVEWSRKIIKKFLGRVVYKE